VSSRPARVKLRLSLFPLPVWRISEKQHRVHSFGVDLFFAHLRSRVAGARLSLSHQSDLEIVTAAVAIIPLAEWIRRATEQIAAIAGPAIGGLLNISFGNAAELILALFVLAAGKPGVVKASITGSIIGNSLLGLGVAALAGGWKRQNQRFSRERAGLLGSLLVLAVIALLVPALFDYSERDRLTEAAARALDERLSLGVAAVLILAYSGNLIYTLVTHRDVFAGQESRTEADWSLWTAIGVLVAATAVLTVEAELVSNALEATASHLGLTEFFLGVVLLPIIGNAAEYMAAISFARQDRMGLSVGIAVGSSIQVALLMAPVVVIISSLMGHPMNLVFHNPL
jgi:Ca2+:H+ antiporter